ncbi:hypothetical protein [Pseudomonas brenneri]|uniref:hypothetical protein n=1 Tax=Pseudomonas brenneri TaxID=129817 RepID=UPI003BA237A2
MSSAPIIPFTLLGRDMPQVEFYWSNEIEGLVSSGPHYASDEKDDSDQVWGIVLVSKCDAGFNAGWSNGEMAQSGYTEEMYTDLVEAGKAAEGLAQTEADRQCAEFR